MHNKFDMFTFTRKVNALSALEMLLPELAMRPRKKRNNVRRRSSHTKTAECKTRIKLGNPVLSDSCYNDIY